MQMLNDWRHRPGFNLGASASSKSTNKAAQRGIAYHKRVYKQLAAHPHGGELHVEPWFQERSGKVKAAMRSPDAVLTFPERTGLVIEVKMNWKPGREEKLMTEYLPIVQNAFGLELVWPLLIVGCLRGYQGPRLLGLTQLDDAFMWEPGSPPPVMLIPT